jgi:hypothetical protein
MKKSKEVKTAPTKLAIKSNDKQYPAGSSIEIQKALKAGRAELRREHRARMQAEKALIEVRQELAAARRETESEPEAQIRRVSFVVRLMLDEHGQFARTEIQHVLSSRRQNFLSLDGDGLVAFMKACINLRLVPLRSRSDQI